MYRGKGPSGGGVLPPGRADHVVPHAGSVTGELANPLNAAGAAPPPTMFSFHHCGPQKVTLDPAAALPSPITNVPPDAPPKTTIPAVTSAVLPPSSTTSTPIVNGPVVA